MTTRLITTLALLLASSQIGAMGGMDPAEMEALRTYCKADVERLCANVQPGEGRIKACLMANKESMSVGCAQALQKLKQSKK